MLTRQNVLDEKEKALLNIIQTDFPLNSQPYKQLSEIIGISELEIKSLIKDLKSKGIIRRLGAIFDYKRLGYVGTLVAAKVAPQDLEKIALKVNEFPNVTHNYARSNEYNLWFTLIAESNEKVTELIKSIGNFEGIEDIKNLPATRSFKINVSFDFINQASKSEAKVHNEKPAELSDKEKKLVVILQENFPLTQKPFADIASKTDFSEDALIEKVKSWIASGVIRRFGAAVSHQKAGIAANGMIVWRVEDEDVEKAGQCLASYSQVTHCYERPSFEGWPYNLYSMVHGPDKSYVLEIAEKIAQECRIKEYKVLFSACEFKKSSYKYFSD